MPQVSAPQRTPPKLDMNPMVDMAFLLVSFFMLTTTFKTEEPVAITLPASQSEVKLPESDIMVITLAEDGRIFFGIDSKHQRVRLLQLMSQEYDVPFTEAQVQAFSLVSTFGVSIQALPDYLDLPPSERKSVIQPGIPLSDSLQNELYDWIVLARMVNPNLRVAINGDATTKYPKVKRVLNTLQLARVNRFNLITNLEQES
ncbi:MAG TPA: biopolymer transporter ExbD [Cytophagales bacterium]|nr:biopolymer transporter ExbD [Cytophagales bacterium]HAA18716.1 biopolymer transporter ExbD [Cytophagales bacterium]HAP63936.1 biopolymer transporter ExbD [Cytophagales bacterium]